MASNDAASYDRLMFFDAVFKLRVAFALLGAASVACFSTAASAAGLM